MHVNRFLMESLVMGYRIEGLKQRKLRFSGPAGGTILLWDWGRRREASPSATSGALGQPVTDT